MGLREWLEETHGPRFELLRHFVRRFFESDVVTSPDHAMGVLIAAAPMCFLWFLMIMGPLKHKYAYFSSLPAPGPYREALQADELCLITLMMAVMGLLTAVKWQALFPDQMDYRTLGSLPVRTGQIYLAKLGALLLVATAALVVLNLLPGRRFRLFREATGVSRLRRGNGRWGILRLRWGAARLCFWGLVGVQGLLRNLPRPGAFAKVNGPVQGGLLAATLTLLVESLGIGPPELRWALHPGVAEWLPPVWFLGVCQKLGGDPNASMAALAGRAWAGLGWAAVLAGGTYVASSLRHPAMQMEGSSGGSRESLGVRVFVTLFSWRPRRRAIGAFRVQTLARSNRHRAIGMAYAGFAVALGVGGMAGMPSGFRANRVVAADFVLCHMLIVVFLVAGTRHLFSIPVELKGNWIFRMTELEGRAEWFRAVDRLVLVWFVMPLVLVPLPLEIRLRGWRAGAEVLLLLVLGLITWEWVFSAWEKLPFTCSSLPGKLPIRDGAGGVGSGECAGTAA